ncbi:MAG: site-2 protease family protein, partial [bacterium]|nr:site-2 protease family protein [bacterium]
DTYQAKFMNILTLLIGFPILIYSIILHEIAHGFVADRLGDPTARLSKRLTLNPIPHIDPVMSLLIPLIMLISTGGQFAFGAAKPVPVDPYNLREGRKDMAIIAVSGPLTNIMIGILLAIVFNLLTSFGIRNLLILQIIAQTIYLNFFLAALNLIPIPPLDGSRILAAILPKDLAQVLDSIEPFGMFILLFLLFFPLGGFSLVGVITAIVKTWTGLLGF